MSTELGKEELKELMEGKDLGSRFISTNFSPYKDSNDLSHVAPTEQDAVNNPYKEIDLDLLLDLAKQAGVHKEEKFKKVYESIRTYKKQLATNAQFEECQECESAEPCCDSNCNVYELLEERYNEKWKEDRHRDLNPCKHCKGQYNCLGVKGETPYYEGKLPKLIRDEIEEFLNLDKETQKALLKDIGLKLKRKTRLRRRKVKDIVLFEENFDLNIRFHLQKVGIKAVTHKTDLSQLPEDIASRVEERFFQEVEKIKEIYNAYNQDIDFDEDAEKANTLKNQKEEFRRIIKENAYAEKIRRIKEKITDCSESYILLFSSTSGKDDNFPLRLTNSLNQYKSYLGETSKYQRNYLEGDILVSKATINRNHNRREILTFNILINNQMDYGNIRKAIDEIVETVGNVNIALPEDITDDRLERIIGVSELNATIYNPWLE